MRIVSSLNCIAICSLFILYSCKERYTPPQISTGANFLVIDGFLNGSADSTVLTLTRTRNLVDTNPPVPEVSAKVQVEGQAGEHFQFRETGPGRYAFFALPLNSAEKYRVTIQTTGGAQYASDFVPYKQSPVIDSIGWYQDGNGVSIYVNTHDPANQSVYYKWDYVETWQYHSYVEAAYDLINGEVVRRDSTDLIYYCWRTHSSTDIVIATSAKLNEDVIYQQIVNSIPTNSEKIGLRYSILVKQYPLTEEGFEYWQNLKKNTEQMGSITDPQPFGVTGNIRCLTNPTEPVLGFITASSVSSKRIFIDSSQVKQWQYFPYYSDCTSGNNVFKGINPKDQATIYDLLLKQNHLFTFMFSTVILYQVGETYCIDCRDHGGSNIQPSFW